MRQIIPRLSRMNRIAVIPALVFTVILPFQTWGQTTPSIDIYQPTGTQRGNVTIPYVITDAENSLVGLLAEYSTNSGSTWQAASVSSDTSDIAAAEYDSSLAWQSGTDLGNQEQSNVWFRITPHDTLGWGTADTTYIDIDNLAPLWVSAEGTVGDWSCPG